MLNYALAIQQSLVHSCVLTRKRKLAAKCALRSSIVWTEAKRSLSVIFCAHSAPVSAIAALQATICLSHSPLQTRSATTMQGFPTPAVGRRRHETQAVIPCILLCPAGYQSRPAAWGRGCVSVGLRKAAVLEQPCPPQGRGQQRAHRCHFALQLLLSKSLKDRVKPFYLPFSERQGVTELGRGSSLPQTPSPRHFMALQGLVPRSYFLSIRAPSGEIQTVPIAASFAEEPLEGTGGCNHFPAQTLWEQGHLPGQSTVASKCKIPGQQEFKERRGL